MNNNVFVYESCNIVSPQFFLRIKHIATRRYYLILLSHRFLVVIVNAAEADNKIHGGTLNGIIDKLD